MHAAQDDGWEHVAASAASSPDLSCNTALMIGDTHVQCHANANADISERARQQCLTLAGDVFACEIVVNNELAVARVRGADGGGSGR